jgi:hypothetical protein
VLPDDGSGTVRLDGDYPEGVPAVELVKVAKVLGRVAELAERNRGGNALGPQNGPGRLALSTLIALSNENDAEVNERLVLLRERIARERVARDKVGWPEPSPRSKPSAGLKDEPRRRPCSRRRLLRSPRRLKKRR